MQGSRFKMDIESDDLPSPSTPIFKFLFFSFLFLLATSFYITSSKTTKTSLKKPSFPIEDPIILKEFENLQSSNPVTALTAIQKLNTLRTPELLPLFIHALEHPNFEIREVAAGSLGYYKNSEAASALIVTLKDPAPSVAQNAAKSLYLFGADLEPFIPELVAVLETSEDPTKSYWLLEILYHFGKEIDEETQALLLEKLSSKNPNIRIAAAGVLGRMYSNPLILEALMKHLKDPDLEVQKNVIRALGNIGLAAKETLPLLNEELKGAFGELRKRIEWSIEQIQPKKIKALPKLEEALKNSNLETRRYALELLVQFIETNPEKVIPLLILALEDKERSIQKRARELLIQFGMKPENFLLLTQFIRHKTFMVEEQVKDILEVAFLKNKLNLSTLVSTFEANPDILVQYWAAETLYKNIEVAPAVIESVFINATQLGNPKIRKIAGNCLRQMKKRRSQSQKTGKTPSSPRSALKRIKTRNIAVIIKGLEHPDPKIREESAVLLSTRVSPFPAYPAILKAINDPNLNVRITIAKLINQIFRNFRNNTTRVKKLFLSRTNFPKEKVDTLINETIELLIQCLKDENHTIHLLAIKTLVQIGPKARPFLKAVQAPPNSSLEEEINAILENIESWEKSYIAKKTNAKKKKIKIRHIPRSTTKNSKDYKSFRRSPNSRGKRLAIKRLAYNPDIPKTMKTLLEILQKEKHIQIQEAAILSIAKIYKKNEKILLTQRPETLAKFRVYETIPSIIKAMESPSFPIRTSAYLILHRAGPACISELEKVENHPNPKVKSNIQHLLVKMRQQEKKILEKEKE